MHITYCENVLTPEQLAFFRNQAEWGVTSIAQGTKAVKNTLFSVVALYEGQVVGIGRLVGDGALIWYIQDLIVLHDFQRKGIGASLVKKLIAYAESNGVEGSFTTIGLMSAKGKEPFYQKFGFHTRPNEKQGAGMVVYKQVLADA